MPNSTTISVATLAIPDAPLDDTYGVGFLGVIAAASLWGLSSLQVYLYFRKYAHDWMVHKAAVVWLWFWDTMHLALITHSIYYYLVTRSHRPTENLVWSFKLQVVVSVIVIFSVQMLYTMRLWKVSKAGGRRLIPMLASILVFVAAVVGLVLCYFIYTAHTFTEVGHISWTTFMSLGTATLVDMVLAGALCACLARCRTGAERMDTMVSVIMVYAINTGILTSICSLSAMAAFAAWPKTFVSTGIQFLLTKLYINSFLAMFNARKSLNQYTGSPSPTEIAIELERGTGTLGGRPSITLSRSASRSMSGSGLPGKQSTFGDARALGISVHTTTVTRVESPGGTTVELPGLQREVGGARRNDSRGEDRRSGDLDTHVGSDDCCSPESDFSGLSDDTKICSAADVEDAKELEM